MTHCGYIDIHTHVLPYTDDGPTDWQEALDLCRSLSDDGIAEAVATPHQLGRFDNQSSCADIFARTEELNQRLCEQNIALKIYPGAEVRLDERICDLLRSGRILTLADGGVYLLLELLPEIAVDVLPFLGSLIKMGITPVIAHIERYPYILRLPYAPRTLLDAGAVFQITASSLAGLMGRTIQDLAWWFLLNGATVVASDAHNTTSRAPQMHQAYQRICQRISVDAANLLCRENPQRMLQGLPVKPILIESLSNSMTINRSNNQLPNRSSKDEKASIR